MKLIALTLTVSLTGCQTMLDPNYALQLESYRLTISAQQNVEVAKARAEEARYNAMAAIAERADPASKQMAILALALSRGGNVEVQPRDVVLPRIPETQEDRALKWAAIFAGPVTAVATGYFGYRLGVAQSNNQANTTIASYNTLASFKPAPIDFTKIPPTSVTNTTNNTSTRIVNDDGVIAVGSNPTASQDNSTRPITVVPPVFNTPVVVVPPVVPIVPVVTGP